MHVYPGPSNQRLAHLTLACLVALSLSPVVAMASPVATTADKKMPSAGIEVKVTPEMTGARAWCPAEPCYRPYLR
jgi:hypothetical protein